MRRDDSIKQSFIIILIIFILLAGCFDQTGQDTSYRPSENNPSGTQHGGGGGTTHKKSSTNITQSSSINKINISPENTMIAVNELFTISIVCTPIESIKAWELTLKYDPYYLQAIDVDQGDFFSGFETFPSPNIFIDNENGIITQLYNLILGPGSVNNTGTLASIEFSPIRIGNSALTFEMIGITNETIYLPVETANGTVRIY